MKAEVENRNSGKGSPVPTSEGGIERGSIQRGSIQRGSIQRGSI